MQDLFGQPIGAKPTFELTLWQKKQATMLYHFASMPYLKGLLDRALDLMKFINPTLDLAERQKRDDYLVDDRWGVRDTVANWTTCGYPKLDSMVLRIRQLIAQRSYEQYGMSPVYDTARALQEISMGWATPQEEEEFDRRFDALGKYASLLDYTCRRDYNYWDDFLFYTHWLQVQPVTNQIPRFKVRSDVEAETGKRPVRTGVYVPQDDPYGCLQFGWTGESGDLLECNTLSQVGLAALTTLGRKNMWRESIETADFAVRAIANGLLTDFEPYEIENAANPEMAPSMIAIGSESKRPCKWYFVELVNDEYEDLAVLEAQEEQQEGTREPQRIRVLGGKTCPHAGYYFSPAQTNSRRHFKQGEVMPSVGGDYGVTIWQWDERQ